MNTTLECSIEFRIFELPLHSNLPDFQQGKRSGILLHIVSESAGLSSLGECTPHPAVSPLSVGELIQEIRDTFTQSEISVTALSPMLQWGIFMAAAPYLFPPFQQMLTPTTFFSVPINALLSTGERDTAIQLLRAGYRSVKVKVGRHPPAEEIQFIREIRSQFPHVDIRLDANANFRFQEAIAFCSQLEPFGIQYIEDPTPDPEEYHMLYEHTGIGIAVDQFFTPKLLQIFQAQIPSWLKAIVVKPPRYSNPFFWKQLYKVTTSYGIPVVFSAAFESSIALHWYAFFHSRWNDQNIQAGLDTFRIFPHQLTPLTFKSGELIFHSALADPSRVRWENTRTLTTWSGKLYWDAHLHR